MCGPLAPMREVVLHKFGKIRGKMQMMKGFYAMVKNLDFFFFFFKEATERF